MRADYNYVKQKPIIMERINTTRPDVKVLAERIALEINNEIEYQLTIQEYHRIRNNEYHKLVMGGDIKDTDDNWDDFDTYLSNNLNVKW
jgi:putative lipase involved disintegration of autophagic bodies